MHKRPLKVCRAYRDYTLKNQSHRGNPCIPSISLKGTWLEQAGFSIELPIFVVVRNNFLAIVPQDDHLSL